jgi:hypothetical protein
MQGWDGHDEPQPVLGTLPAGISASAGNGAAGGGASVGGVTSMTINGSVVLPGAPTGVQQSLLAGKARFRWAGPCNLAWLKHDSVSFSVSLSVLIPPLFASFPLLEEVALRVLAGWNSVRNSLV